MIVSFVQAIFTLVYFNITMPIFNGMLLLGYSTIYTTVPIFTLVLDEGVEYEAVKKYPRLYRSLQKGRALNTLSFLCWTWKSIIQACLIMYLAIVVLDNDFLNIVTITFTTVVILETLNVFSEVQRLKQLMWLSGLATVVIYLGTIWLMPQYMGVAYLDWYFFLNVFWLTLICWAPFHFIARLMRYWAPSEEDRILSQEGCCDN